MTYGSMDKHLKLPTYGGYSETIVVDEHFTLHIPPNLDLAGVAPLLCAGITTYSPLRHNKVVKGQKVGIVRFCECNVSANSPGGIYLFDIPRIQRQS